MRKEFSAWIENEITRDKKTTFLTGDLGFQAFEKVAELGGDRFVNMGVAEQNMMSVAAALAHEGMAPICYSIAPFTVFRPAEQIRLDICVHNKNVKIVGNGGGYGYGVLGATHHALEDLACLTSYQKMRTFIPYCGEDVAEAGNALRAYEGPGYLRLGHGIKPSGLLETPFASVRKLLAGNQVTVLALGPMVLQAIEGVRMTTVSADVFVASELPFTGSIEALIQSLNQTRKLLILEDHVKRGGLGEYLALQLMERGCLPPQMIHRTALGYPSKRYGNQSFHLAECGLDAKSVAQDLQSLTR